MRVPDPFQFGTDPGGEYWEVTGYTVIERLGEHIGETTNIPWVMYYPASQGVPPQGDVSDFADRAGEEFLEFIGDTKPGRRDDYGDIVSFSVASVHLVQR